jgi:hypothetical protein
MMLSLPDAGYLTSGERPFAALPAFPLVLGVICRVGLVRLRNLRERR